MNQKSFHVLFFLKKNKIKANGEAPIAMRITVDKRFREMFVRRSALVENWDQTKGKLKTKDKLSTEINQKINSDYLNGYFSNIFISLDKKRTLTLNHIQNLIIEEYNDQNRSILMESYLQSFLFHIASFNENKILSNNRNVVLFIEFVKLTDNNFIRNRDVVFYAKELNISEKKLNEVCKALSGKTTKQFIQERLILEIKKEIKLGTKNLKEIAFELGFNESAYLTRFFKQQTSISPSEFKEEK